MKYFQVSVPVLLFAYTCIHYGIFAQAAPNDNAGTAASGTLISSTVDNRHCQLFSPVSPAAGNPWIWCDHALDLLSEQESALLKKGCFLAYTDVHELWGNAAACAHWTSFYAWLMANYPLAPKAAIMCSDKGALTAFNWAAANVDKVACIYAETPWVRLAEPEGKPLPEELLAAYALEVPDKAADVASGALHHAATLGAAALPLYVTHPDIRDERPYVKDMDKFYYDYSRAGQGLFYRLRKKVLPKAAPDTVSPVLHFILRNTNQLPEAPFGAPISQMPEWTPADFSGRSAVRVMDNILFIEEGGEMTGITCAAPPPTMNYEITLEAMRVAGDDFFCGLTAPYKDTVFSLIIGGWGGTCVGISSLDWLDAYHNETAQFRTFYEHQWYHIRLRVTEDKIEAWIDEEQMVNVNVAEREVDIRWEMAPTKPMGIATWRTTGAIRNFSIRTL